MSATNPGKVYLVGAGPGDPGLITVKGLRLLERAEAVVYDRLVGSRLLEHAPAKAHLVDVGKERGARRMSQEEINTLLVRLAREGKRVVRLKGGDPFLFGRGGEEAESLAAAGIPFEVVPGVTSALAVPAYAGIPVTHRGVAASLAIVTGSEDPAKVSSQVDWGALAKADTLVVLMGMETLPQVTKALVEAGRPVDTPAALIEWGTLPRQRTVTGTLADIAQRAQAQGIRPPTITVVGNVVRLRERLRWFDNLPLLGKRVLVTRTRQQAGVLAEMLAQQGAWPVEVPAIAIEPLKDLAPLDAALGRLSEYTWAVFTSANAVDLLFGRLRALGRDARSLGGTRVAAIGPGTARALDQHGIVADLTPGEAVSEGLAEALAPSVESGQRVLLPRALEGRPTLPEALRRLGAMVDEVPLYRTVCPEDTPQQVRQALEEGIDAVTFTSSSTVRHLVDALQGNVALLSRATVACIGPITAQTAKELGLSVTLVAQEHTVEGLVQALVRHTAASSTAQG
ncbi:MAG: uroporphyrinogen-III C-methyltransferase [Chloroflexi bacterium]|nr:uroporphyrinogen-III C-methyltransferase [Chloroflexota bacterium]